MLNWEVSKIFLVKNKPFLKTEPINDVVGALTKKEGFAEGRIIGAGALVYFLGFMIKIALDIRELTSNACWASLSRGNRWKIRISLTLHSLLIHRIWKRNSKRMKEERLSSNLWKILHFDNLSVTANLKKYILNLNYFTEDLKLSWKTT